MKHYFLIILLSILIISSCDFKKQKNRVVKKVKKEVKEHVINPTLNAGVNLTKGIIHEVLKEDTINYCENYRPNNIISISKDDKALSPITRRMVELTPDSLLKKINQPFFIQDSTKHLPLYFPYSLHYRNLLEGNFHLYMLYCPYSHLEDSDYWGINGDIDKIWVYDYWLAVRKWDSDQLLGMSNDLDVQFFLINMQTQETYEYNSEELLLKGAKEKIGKTAQLKTANEFLEWYNDGGVGE